MKKLDTKGSALAVVLLIVVIAAAVGGVGYYVWSKDKNKDSNSTTQTSQPSSESTQTSSVVAIPDNFTADNGKAQELQSKSTVDGAEYQYYTDVDTATIITVMTRPTNDKDLTTPSLVANSVASTVSKIEFPTGTKVKAEAATVKGTDAAGYLVVISNMANKAQISYIGAANKDKVALVTVRSPEAYKTEQNQLVQDLINSIQL